MPKDFSEPVFAEPEPEKHADITGRALKNGDHIVEVETGKYGVVVRVEHTYRQYAGQVEVRWDGEPSYVTHWIPIRRLFRLPGKSGGKKAKDAKTKRKTSTRTKVRAKTKPKLPKSKKPVKAAKKKASRASRKTVAEVMAKARKLEPGEGRMLAGHRVQTPHGIGLIQQIEELDGEVEYVVKLEDNPKLAAGRYRREDLSEPLAALPAPKFKVGDRVHACHDPTDTGTVVAVNEHGVDVHWDGEQAPAHAYDEKEIELLEASPTPKNGHRKNGSQPKPAKSPESDEQQERDAAVLAYLERTPGVGAGPLIEHLGCSKAQLRTSIDRLLKGQRVRREGKAKGAKYFRVS